MSTMGRTGFPGRSLSAYVVASTLLLGGCAASTGTQPESDCALIVRIWRADLPGSTSDTSGNVTVTQFAKVSVDLAAAASTTSRADLRSAVQGLANAYGQLAGQIKGTGATGNNAAMNLYVTSVQRFTKLCGQI
jgi:hypothetical protein